jgi:hypothetical protein
MTLTGDVGVEQAWRVRAVKAVNSSASNTAATASKVIVISAQA